MHLRILPSPCPLLLAVGFVTAGCASGHWFTPSSGDASPKGERLELLRDRDDPPAETSAKSPGKTTKATGKAASPAADVKAPDETAALPKSNATSADDASQWQSLVDQIAQRSDLDPQARTQLLRDLREVDPALRPTLARTMIATLLYTRSAQRPASDGDAASRAPATDSRSENSPPVAVKRDSSAPPTAADPSQALRKSPPSQPRLAVAPPAKLLSPVAGGASNASAAGASPFASAAAMQRTLTLAALASDPAEAASTGSSALPWSPANPLPPVSVSVDPAAAAARPDETASPASRDWKGEVAQAIRILHDLAAAADNDAARAHLEGRMRLLQLAADQTDAALKAGESLDPNQREYWKHQLFALSTMLSEKSSPVASRRAAIALRELDQAQSQLASLSALDVRNLAFCTKVDSFGRYSAFPKAEFRADQEVLLYAEIGNVTVQSKGEAFESSLQGSYQILSAAGQRVADHSWNAETDLCRSRRHDYFIPFRLYLPKRIEPGDYTLQLTVEDLLGKKFGQAVIPFSITR